MFKNLVLALLAVGLAGFVVWSLRNDSGSETNSGDLNPAADQATETAGARQAAELDARPRETSETQGERNAVAIEPDPETSTTDSKARQVTTLQGATRALYVIDQDTGGPVEGADVFQCSMDWLSRHSGLHFESVHQATQWIARAGFEVVAPMLDEAPYFQSDLNGRVGVKDAILDTLVIAQAGTRRGFGIVGGRYDTGATIGVAEPRTLTVRTVDASGVAMPNVTFGMQGVTLVAGLGTLRTNATGTWTRHEINTMVEPIRRKLAASDATDASDADEVRMGLLDSASAEWVALDLAAGGTVDLVVASGQVVVTVVDEAGQPLVMDVAKFILRGAGRPRLGTLSDDSSATFGGVPVGSEVTVSMSKFFELSIALPAPATGVVGAEPLQLQLVSAGADAIALRLRVMDGSQAGAAVPLRSAAVRLHQELLESESTQSSVQEVETDSEGFVSFASTTLESDLLVNQMFELLASCEAESSKLRSRVYRFEGPFHLPHDLGEIVLEPAEPFVSGRVVNADGQPVFDAWVTLSRPSADAADSDSTVERLVFTDSQGRFESFGQSRAMGWSLRAKRDGYGKSEPMAFQAGQQDLLVPLVAYGSIVMSTAPESRATASFFRVWLKPDDSVPSEEFNPTTVDSRSMARNIYKGAGANFDARGELTWTSLAPGLYQVRIEKDGVDVAEIDDVLVRAGEPTRDPRLTNLQLEADLCRIELEVLDEAGAPIKDFRIERPDSFQKLKLTGGALLVQEMSGEVRISAEGLMTAKLVLDQLFKSVTLRKQPTVSLRFPLALEDTDQIKYRVALIAKEGRRGNLGDWSLYRKPQGNVANVPVEAFGTQRVVVDVERAAGAGVTLGDGVQLSFAIDLEEGCDGTVIDVAITDAERAQLE